MNILALVLTIFCIKLFTKIDGLNSIHSVHFSHFSNSEQYYVDSYYGYVNAWHFIPRYLQTCSLDVLYNIKSKRECSVQGWQNHECLAFIYVKESSTCKLCLNTDGIDFLASQADKLFIASDRFIDFIHRGKRLRLYVLYWFLNFMPFTMSVW